MACHEPKALGSRSTGWVPLPQAGKSHVSTLLRPGHLRVFGIRYPASLHVTSAALNVRQTLDSLLTDARWLRLGTAAAGHEQIRHPLWICTRKAPPLPLVKSLPRLRRTSRVSVRVLSDGHAAYVLLDDRGRRIRS